MAHHCGMETLYTKQGRRYVPYGNLRPYEDGDLMKPGEFRLTYCDREGSRRYEYAVTPDTAGFVAAASIAKAAMEAAMIEADKMRPATRGEPLTKKQQALVKKFAADMEAAGGWSPMYWTRGQRYAVIDAGIEAVRNYRP